MKTILAILLVQIISADLPPPLPRVVVVEGRAGALRLDAAACAQPLGALGGTWRCRPDHTLILAVPIGYPLGPFGITNLSGQTVAIVDVGMTGWPEDHRPISKPRPVPAGRLERDKASRDTAYGAHRDPRWAAHHLRLPLGRPLLVEYRITDPFGMRRFYGEATEPEVHSGTDMAAPKTGGWDVTAPPSLAVAPGVVVLAGELWNSGNTVILYHGDGVYTAYCHLDSIAVASGDEVPAGAKLGIVGGTVGGGRIGKHLHLTMRVGEVYVDPLESITALNGSLR